MTIRRSVWEILFDSFNVVFMICLGIITVFPFITVLVTSISTNAEANAAGMHLFTRNPTLYAYENLFQNKYLLISFRNSVARTVVGTALNVIFTCLLAYPLSKKYLPLRNFWTLFFVFTMFFSGGLIPTYLLIKDLHLLDKFLVFVIPGLISTYNMIITRNFFQALPAELDESAKIDGANEFVVLFRIIVPISVPIIATITLWCAVGHWNAWFDAVLYTTREDLIVLQKLLYRIVVQGSMQMMEQSGMQTDVNFKPAPVVTKAATIMVSSIPIIMVYPFVQRYFMKGILIGSLKG